MFTNTYFWHYVITFHSKNAKYITICDTAYRRDAALCMRVWKKIGKEKKWEKKMSNNEKKSKDYLSDVAVYFKLSFFKK